MKYDLLFIIIKKHILTIIICFTSLITLAQTHKATIYGMVTDDKAEPVIGVAVVLQTIDSVYIGVTTTDIDGRFKFDSKTRPYRLLIQHLTYHNLTIESSKDSLGTIILKENSNQLAAVVVKADRSILKVEDGKMTYKMSQLLKNKMATSAYEAILELPGVQQRSGKIELAGANMVTVVINGKTTNMGESQLENLLKNMPKERIQLAEIMYSAPPQYHVRGAVINLVLKTGGADSTRLQGQINTSYNQGYYANYKAGATLVYNTPKSTTDFMYSFGYERQRNGEDVFSHHLFKGEVYNIEQFDRGYTSTPIHTFRLGNDWNLNDKNKVSFAYTSEIQQWSHPFTSSKGTYSNSENKKVSDSPIQMHNLELGYVSGFGLSTGIDFTYYKNHTTQYYKENMAGKEDAFNAQSKQNIRRLSFYADQNHKLGKDWSINYGTKFSFASDKSSQIYNSLNIHNWEGSNSSSKLNEYVYNLYAGFSKSFSNNLSLSAALTGEYYKHKEIDYWSLFPMMEFTYVANSNNIFQLSVSSDKTYPSYWEMQNSISYLSGYAEIQGNTLLRPSKLYSAQLNYILKNKYIFTLYTNYIDDNFNQLPYQAPNRLVLIYKTLNSDYSSKFGLNVVVPFKVGFWLDSRLTLNGYYDKTKSKHYYDISFNKDNFAFYVGLNNIFNISSKPNIKAELSGSYITRNIQGPMVISSMYRVDAGAKWISNNNRIELSFKVNDMFNSWTPKYLYLQYKTQNLVMNMIPDSRMVSLSFIYKFGNYKVRQHKEVDRSRFGK
ncbi:MAG: outer membrane beta-barrel family protein [Bacteroidales bacterium]